MKQLPRLPAYLKPLPPSARRPLLAALMAAGLAASTGARPVLAETYDATFDFRIAGIKAGEIAMAGDATGNAYVARAEVRTAGVIGIFADFFYDGTSEGWVTANGRLVPVTFTASSRSPRDDRETRIDWEEGTPVYVSVEPPRSTSPEPSTQTGTLDPVSASFALLRDGPRDEVCAKSVDIFDGSRRSRITLGAMQEEDGQLVCNGSFERLEGEENTFDTRAAYAFRLIYSEAGESAAKLERIETRTEYGNAALVRQ